MQAVECSVDGGFGSCGIIIISSSVCVVRHNDASCLRHCAAPALDFHRAAIAACFAASSCARRWRRVASFFCPMARVRRDADFRAAERALLASCTRRSVDGGRVSLASLLGLLSTPGARRCGGLTCSRLPPSKILLIIGPRYFFMNSATLLGTPTRAVQRGTSFSILHSHKLPCGRAALLGG